MTMKKFIASTMVFISLFLSGDTKMTDMANEQDYNNAFHSMDTWRGGDQTTSVKLNDGRIVWLFNDTYNHKGDMLHNSVVIQNGSKFSHMSNIKEVIPNDKDGSFYWPFSAVQHGNMLLVSCARMRLIGSGHFDFQVMGVDVARLLIDLEGVKYIDKMKTPASDAGEFGILWGAAMHKNNGYIYMYGSKKVLGQFGKSAYVARFSSKTGSPSRGWEYWNGSDWIQNEQYAVPIIHARDGGVSTTFSAYNENNTWKIVTKEYDAIGDSVVMYTSSKPFGKFSKKLLMESASRDGHFTYNPMAHPWARVGEGNLLLSINHNGDYTEYMPTFHIVRSSGNMNIAVCKIK